VSSPDAISSIILAETVKRSIWTEVPGPRRLWSDRDSAAGEAADFTSRQSRLFWHLRYL